MQIIKFIENFKVVFASHFLVQEEVYKGRQAHLYYSIFLVNSILKFSYQSCDPVLVNNTEQSCSLWSEDLFCISQTGEGLQNAIYKLISFNSSLGLQLHSFKRYRPGDLVMPDPSG